MKKYSNINVYDAAKERISFIFDEFEHVVVSFSGGKDSGVVLNLVIDEARRRKRRVTAVFIDLEAFYEVTIKYVEKMFSDNADVLDPMWICLPMESPNALSYFSPTWTWWERGKEEIWVRNLPKNEWVINIENHEFLFYKEGMPFEKFTPLINEWQTRKGKTAVLLGLRAEESLNRHRSINSNKATYKGRQWSTKIDNSYMFNPIYDWTVEDIWTYNGKFNKEYNHLYDLFYKAGVSLHKMRVDEPFGNEAKAGLNLFRVIEPQTWAKVANRVSGANFGNIYSGNKIMTANYKLPNGHTWKSFTKFLLATLPDDLAMHYKRKFIKFIKYWNKVGCPLKSDFITELETDYGDYITNTHSFSKRGKGDKEVVKFRKIIDSVPSIDSKDDILTWKRMAMCIIKNDYICKGLSFSITKNLSERSKYLVEKYKEL